MKKKPVVLFLLIEVFLSFSALSAQNPGAFPGISRLDLRDLGYRQYQTGVEAAYLRIAELEHKGADPAPLLDELMIFSYQVREEEDIFSIAARCNVPYAAIATVNRLNHPSSLKAGALLLLPSVPGIFIPADPKNDLEYVMAAAGKKERAFPVSVTRNGRRESFYFLPGADFSPTERVFFLNTSFRFPLRTYTLSSSFGPRISPITGNLSFHGGLDLAAPEGTDVFAARGGVVTETGEDDVLGKYVIIRHGETWVSLYGHLSRVLVDLRSTVESASLIGKVGSTGLSTGPHLHFELRQNGRAQDPGKYLFREGPRP